MSPTVPSALAGVIAVAVGLAGCHPAGAGASSSAAPASGAQAQPTAAATAPVQAAAAPAAAFQVVISLSPAAAARLAGNGQTITVPAEFYGNPISERERMADQGRLDLAPEQDVVLTGAGVASFTAPQLDPSKLAQVEGG